jgi:hypothetical protein
LNASHFHVSLCISRTNSDSFCRLSEHLYEAHFNKKLPEDILILEPRVKEFDDIDKGAEQFVNRFSEISSSLEERDVFKAGSLISTTTAS